MPSMFTHWRMLDAKPSTHHEFSMALIDAKAKLCSKEISVPECLGRVSALYLHSLRTEFEGKATEDVRSLFFELALNNPEMARSEECWNVFELLSYPASRPNEDWRAELVKFVEENMHKAPASAYSNLDAMLNSGAVSSEI